MFVLQKNPAALESAKAEQAVILDARQRLADASAGLTFEPEQHRYFFFGREMRSVSSIIEHFAPFDTLAAAQRAAKNPRHPLYGKSVEEIVALWELKRDNAAAAGTSVHSFAEACCLFLHDMEDEMEPQWKERISDAGLVATEPKEKAVARWWASIDWNRYAFVAKETRLVNPMLGYAGTFDLLLLDRYMRSFVMDDFKTNEDLYKWYGDYLRPPLSMLKANDLEKYTVQQTLYSIVVKALGMPLCSNNLIWLRETGFEEVALSMIYERVIQFAVSQLKQ